jgi:site-specific recombinase XerD
LIENCRIRHHKYEKKISSTKSRQEIARMIGACDNKKHKLVVHILYFLRHSFATHQLENVANLRYNQPMHGRAWPETTQIRTRVATNRLNEISDRLRHSHRRGLKKRESLL